MWSQCYVPPASGDFPAFTPAEANTRSQRDARLSWPGWWLYPMIVYPPRRSSISEITRQCHGLELNRQPKVAQSRFTVIWTTNRLGDIILVNWATVVISTGRYVCKRLRKLTGRPRPTVLVALKYISDNLFRCIDVRVAFRPYSRPEKSNMALWRSVCFFCLALLALFLPYSTCLALDNFIWSWIISGVLSYSIHFYRRFLQDRWTCLLYTSPSPRD